MAFKEFCTGVSAFLNIVPEGLLLTSKLNNSRKSPMRLDTVDDWKRLKEDYRTAAENAEVAYKKAREKWKAAGKTTARPKKKVVEIVIVHRGGEKVRDLTALAQCPGTRSKIPKLIKLCLCLTRVRGRQRQRARRVTRRAMGTARMPP